MNNDDKPEIVQNPLDGVVLHLAKNAKYLTPEAQSVIAKYLGYQTSPGIKVPGGLTKFLSGLRTTDKQHYSHFNSMGARYHLNKKDVKLRGGKPQTIYYFSKDIRPEACALPEGFTVHENPHNGFLTVRRPESETDESCEDD